MVTFAKPPLKEVVLGKVFAARPDLLIPYLGTFWSRIRDTYPKTAHAQIVLAEGESPVIDATGNWVPRLWFTSVDDAFLVQVQQDRLYLNWRDTESGTPYVRFPTLLTEFNRVWTLFEQLVLEFTGAPIVPVRNELTYTNFVPAGPAWSSVIQLGNVLRDFSWSPRGRVIGEPKSYSSRTLFDLPDDAGHLRVNVDTARRRSDASLVLKLELQATGSASGALSWDRWVVVAHDSLVQGFKDLTTEQMHSAHWKLS